jgi:hypothetical protein
MSPFSDDDEMGGHLRHVICDYCAMLYHHRALSGHFVFFLIGPLLMRTF